MTLRPHQWDIVLSMKKDKGLLYPQLVQVKHYV